MRNITETELKNILHKHERWLMECEDGMKADLTGANLEFADLTFANTVGAEMENVNLNYAEID